MLVRKVHQYMGSRGERVEALVLTHSETDVALTSEEAAEQNIEEPLVVYAGVATIMSAIPGPDGNPVAAIPNELRFPIQKANDPGEALERYPKDLETFLDELKEQQQKAAQEAQSELYIPNAAESEAINNMKIAGTED